MGLTLLGSQLVAAAVLWVTTFLVGTLPSLVGSRAKQRHHRGQKPGTANGQFESNGNGPKGAPAAHDDAPRSLAFAKVLSFLMNFGGGVLFATCFIHMLPEVRESFSSGGNKQQPSAHDDSSTTVTTTSPPTSSDGFPLPELLVCSGFFIVYLAEEIVHACITHSHQPHKNKHTEHNGVVAGAQAKKKKLKGTRKSSGTRKRSRGRKCSREALEEAVICQTGANYGAISCISEADDDASQATSPLLPSIPSPLSGRKSANECPSECEIEEIESSLSSYEDGRDSRAEAAEKEALPVFRCLMIVIALSFHSIFDGLAIGLQNSVLHVYQLLLAISVHKLLIAFVVGLDVYSETLSLKRVLLYMIPFSVMSPIGVLIACFTKMNVSPLISGVLSAIATGSVLYITFFEILLRERSSSKLPGILQFFAVLSGFSLMALVQYLTEHEH